MLKSEKMLLQHHKNKKQHTKKINSPWATFLWNGDTDKISFLKAEAELNGKTNCETLNVTSPLSSLSKQRTLTWPELLQLLFRTEIRKKKKIAANCWSWTAEIEGLGCTPNSNVLFAVWATQPAEFRKPNPYHLLRQVWRWCKSQLA